eukprot:gene6818-9204_t
MAGMSETDWSWTPIVTDFDNDGFRDLIVTNGFPRDVSDHDFIAYRNNAIVGESSIELLDKIPVVKIPNYAFKNTDGLLFNDVSTSWGLGVSSFSNGGVYADLDNDGDMDMVINNINDDAFLYENTVRGKIDTAANYLQNYENTPYRGYLSSNQNLAHFGLGKTTTIDSVVIKWYNNKKQTIKNVKANQLLKVSIKDAQEEADWNTQKLKQPPLFKEVTAASGINYIYKDLDFNDFSIQTNLLHKLSDYTPGLAAGDIDANGFDDIIIGGAPPSPYLTFLQQPDGRFIQKKYTGNTGMDRNNVKNEGLLLFDANGDG